MKVYLRKISTNDNPHAEGLKLLSEIYGKPYSLTYGERSKPYIKDDESFFFNISHSGEYVCIAVSSNEVGIDIEQHKDNRTRLAKRFYTPKEQEHCISGIEAFYDIWTQKEAFIKATGKGLSYGLNTFCVFDKQIGYTIKNIQAPIGYSLSVCEKSDTIEDIEIIEI